jgi:RNA polymerase sigma factor (sigma-70 family)
MSRRTLIQQLFAEHAGALQAFFRRRIRERRAAADLTQEVYLRLLRADENRISNPEAYLFTVANNLLKEHFVMQRRHGKSVELTHPEVLEAQAQNASSHDRDPAYGIDLAIQARGLRTVLPELPARSQLVLLLTFEEELSHQQIADRLGVSKTLVHKILTQAIGHCRKRLAQLEVL